MSNEFYLEVGDFSYAFEFIIPHDIAMPTSFEYPARSAYIRYWVGGVIHTYWPWVFNVKTNQTFMFLNNYDLNQLGATVRSPLIVTDKKVFGFCFCQSKPIYIALRINKSIFFKFVSYFILSFEFKILIFSKLDLYQVRTQFLIAR